MLLRALLTPTLAIALSIGCGKDKGSAGGGGEDCKPLTVTIGGEPLANLGHGLGYVEGDAHSVHVFNHGNATCEQMLAKSRATPDGEESVGFGLGGYGASIGYASNGKIGSGVEVKLVKKPEKAGDPIAMCVKATLPIKNGKHAGKELVAEGLVEGKFCGERK